MWRRALTPVQPGFLPGVRGKEINSLLDCSRTQQSELREAQSVPPGAEGNCCREGSSACRCGPLPLYQSEPPCSRKRSGDVGSTPSVRFNDFVFLFARKAAKTLSGVNGTSCKRTPTAS